MFPDGLDQFSANAKNLADKADPPSVCDKKVTCSHPRPWLGEATILLGLLTGSLSRFGARRLRAILQTRPARRAALWRAAI